MNNVTLVGRIVRDLEVRYAQNANSTCIARFTVAVDRRFKRDGEPTADFIPVVAMGKNGEFAEKYFRKGMRVGVAGHIQTGSYTNKDGQKVYTTDVIADNLEFCESKNEGGTPAPAADVSADGSGFMNIPDGLEEELPFN